MLRWTIVRIHDGTTVVCNPIKVPVNKAGARYGQEKTHDVSAGDYTRYAWCRRCVGATVTQVVRLVNKQTDLQFEYLNKLVSVRDFLSKYSNCRSVCLLTSLQVVGWICILVLIMSCTQ